MRKVTIINNKTQSQKVIQDSEATTLGELKREMRERGIEYEGMTFYEGHLRAELKDDSSPLPATVPWKGQEVSDLTFLITAPEKKIKSGAMDRKELIAAAKKLGFPGNPTQAKSSVLSDFITSHQLKKAEEKKVAKKAETKVEAKAEVKEEKQAKAVNTTQTHECGVAIALRALLDELYSNDYIDEDAHEKIRALISGEDYKAPEKLSKKEINEMFSFVEQ